MALFQFMYSLTFFQSDGLVKIIVKMAFCRSSIFTLVAPKQLEVPKMTNPEASVMTAEHHLLTAFAFFVRTKCDSIFLSLFVRIEF